MIIYLVVYSLLLIFIFFDNKVVPRYNKKIILFFLIAVFTLFRGLRWNTGTDWHQFYETFLYANWDTIFTFHRYGEQTLEFGYVFLNVVVKSLGGDYTAFLLLTNLFVLCSYVRFSLYISKTPIIVFAVLLFTTNFFPVRLNIAAAVVLFAYVHILNRSLIKFLLVVFAASTIHTSALIFLPFYFIFQIRIPQLAAIAIFLLTIAGGNIIVQRAIMTFVATKFTFLGNMVNLRLQAYMEFERLTQVYKNNVLSSIVSMFFLILFSHFKKTRYQDSATYNLAYNSFIFYFVISEFFRFSMEQMARTANYFFSGFPVLIAIVITDISLKKEFKGITYFLFIAYMYYKFFGSINNFYPELHVPYRSILNLAFVCY